MSKSPQMPVYLRRACSCMSADGGFSAWLDAKYGAGRWIHGDYPREGFDVAIPNRELSDLAVEYGHSRLVELFRDAATFVGEPIEHRKAPANGEIDESLVSQPVADSDLPSGQSANLQPDAVDRGAVIEASQQGLLDLCHATSLVRAAQKEISENGQALSKMERSDAA